MKINTSSFQLKEAIISSLNDGRSLSMVRLGDGEMIIANNDQNKLKHFCLKQIGREITLAELNYAQNNLINSVLFSNILGIPTAAHCKKGNLWKEMFSYYQNIKENNENSWYNKQYCSINAHLDLLASGYLFDIFKCSKKIMIISPRDIVNPLKKKFTNIQSLEWHCIPGEQRYEVIKNKEVNIFNRFEHISSTIKSKSRQKELLIFGVGPFGKHLGIDFAKMGGVSLDLGSVFDLFVGKQTRGPGRSSTAKINKFLL